MAGTDACLVVDSEDPRRPDIIPPGPNAGNGLVPGALEEPKFLHAGFGAFALCSASLWESVKALLISAVLV